MIALILVILGVLNMLVNNLELAQVMILLSIAISVQEMAYNNK